MDNKKISALIIDDEQKGRQVLKNLLKNFCPEIYVCNEADNINDGYELITKLKPDVVFLDIQMPGGNGFELLKKFSFVPFEVVFVTSYDQYAIEAIKFSALDYLLKPIEVAELLKCMKKISYLVEKKHERQLQLIHVIDQVENRESERKIAVHHNDRVIFLPLSNITHLEGERNYTIIYSSSDEKYTSSKNLGEFEDMLQSYPVFFRIGKSCIVNLNHISGYTKGEPCSIFIKGEYSFEISRRKKQEFLEYMKAKK